MVSPKHSQVWHGASPSFPPGLNDIFFRRKNDFRIFFDWLDFLVCFGAIPCNIQVLLLVLYSRTIHSSVLGCQGFILIRHLHGKHPSSSIFTLASDLFLFGATPNYSQGFTTGSMLRFLEEYMGRCVSNSGELQAKQAAFSVQLLHNTPSIAQLLNCFVRLNTFYL